MKCSKPSLSGVIVAGWTGGRSVVTSHTGHSLVYASKIYLQEISCILSNFVSIITQRLSESKIINHNIVQKMLTNWLFIKRRELHSSLWKTRAGVPIVNKICNKQMAKVCYLKDFDIQ